MSNSKCILVIIAIVSVAFQVHCVPISPCSTYFTYNYDGHQWFGVATIYSQNYERFIHTNQITLNLTLNANRYIPALQDVHLLGLYKSFSETLNDIAARQPIFYRISFPFQNVIPELISIKVNNVPVCINHMRVIEVSSIKLGNTIFLSTPIDKDIDDFDYDFHFNVNQSGLVIEDPLTPPSHRFDPDQQKNEFQNTNAKCGTYDDEFKYTQLISGGDKIVAGTWPWLVAIFRKDSMANLVFLCTGNLITNRIVLTAAHCFKMSSHLEKISPKKIVLSFGRYDLRDWTEKNMRLSDANEIHLHPDYLKKRKNRFEADIAAVITKDFIEYNEMIKPICLWPSSIHDSFDIIGGNSTLVGWGQQHENLDTNIPRRLTLPIVSLDNCFPSEKMHQLKRRVLCAGNEKHGNAPCSGDSGTGAAIHANGLWFLRGIVSAAVGDPNLNKCELNTFAILTDVVYFRDWIDKF